MVPMKLARTAPTARKAQVVPGRGDQVAREVDAARDGEEREEQHDERDVLVPGGRRPGRARDGRTARPGRRGSGRRAPRRRSPCCGCLPNQGSKPEGKTATASSMSAKGTMVQNPSCLPSSMLSSMTSPRSTVRRRSQSLRRPLSQTEPGATPPIAAQTLGRVAHRVHDAARRAAWSAGGDPERMASRQAARTRWRRELRPLGEAPLQCARFYPIRRPCR